MLRESCGAFARQTELIRARLLSGSILQSDETSMRVGKKTWWAWVFHDADSACFRIRPSSWAKRWCRVSANSGLSFRVPDLLWRPDGLATTGHQACLAHLLRDVQYAIEAGDLAFAPGSRSC